MQAFIVFDNPDSNVAYTNLDTVSGKAIIRCPKAATVNSVLVKLEGESRTRLMGPQMPGSGKQKPQLEYHKVLYRVQMVFPDVTMVEGRAASKGTFTLSPGTHEYPWSFKVASLSHEQYAMANVPKIPFNNSCATDKSQMPQMSIAPGGFEIAKPATRHVKKTLPPTLSGFPGEAEIRYYIKCTVERQSFLQQNTRTFMPFNFFPIEPPRPPVTGDEVYARQKHTFNPVEEEGKGKSKLKDMFGSKSKESPANSNAPYVSIDARLPSPSILNCNGDVPLRLIAKKLNDCEGVVYLQSLQVSLVGVTKVRAHNAHRTEHNSWIIMSKSNMGVPLGRSTDAIDTETIIDDRMWRGQSLPNTVAPSFETCNITRTYQLDVRIGLSYAGSAQNAAKVRKGQIPKIPQSVILPLRLDVQVFSGIEPPAELLRAMAEAKANPNKRFERPQVSTAATNEKLRMEGRDHTQTIPPTPVDASGPSYPPTAPGREGQPTGPDEPRYDDAPPSYEDAIASDLPPVDAPRPNYAPPPPQEDDGFHGDEKKGFGR